MYRKITSPSRVSNLTFAGDNAPVAKCINTAITHGLPVSQFKDILSMAPELFIIISALHEVRSNHCYF
jgi:hypothetical protein